MYQQIIIVGNLGADPSMRYTPDGVPVTSFSVATYVKWRDDGGTQHERVTWWRVTAWRKLAETCNEYLTKGRQVLVTGTMSAEPDGNPRIWTDNAGNTRASFELRADTVRFIGGSGSARGDEPAPAEELPF